MNKENVRKELKRLDSLIFEARMCLSGIEKEFYKGKTVYTHVDEGEDEFYDVQYTGEAAMTAGLSYTTGRDPGDENGSE